MKHDFTLTLPSLNQKLGWTYLIFELFLLPSILYSLAAAAGIVSDALLNCIYYVINFVVCLILFWPLLRRSVSNAVKKPGSILLTAVIGYLFFQLSSFVIGYLIISISPDFANVNDAAVAELVYAFPLPMLLCVAFLVPVAEECLFRGLLFAPLYRKKPAAAYALSVLLFAAVHVIGYIGSYSPVTLILCFVQYIPAGLALCWALAKTDSLITPILIHCAVNLLSVLTLR